MRKTISILFALALVLSFSLVAATPVAAAGLTVDPGQPAVHPNYWTIQAAINAAVGGETIVVAAGTYSENVIVNKSVSLVGSAGAILDGTGIGGNGVLIQASDISVEGFEITNYAIGIRTYGGPSNFGDLSIVNCNVHGNNQNGMLIVYDTFGTVLIEGCQIDSNSQNGIGISDGAQIASLQITGTSVSSNGATIAYSGIYIASSGTAIASLTASSLTMSGNKGCGVLIDSNSSVSNASFSGASITGSDVNFSVRNSQVDGLALVNCQLSGSPTNHGFWLRGGNLNNLSAQNTSFSSNRFQGFYVSDGGVLSNATIVGGLIEGNDWGFLSRASTVTNLAVRGVTISNNGNGSGLSLASGTVTGLTVEDCTFQNNAWEHLDIGIGWIGVLTASDVSIECNTFGAGPWASVYVDGAAVFGGSDISAHFNEFVSGAWGVFNGAAVSVDAVDNWWGAENGPSGAGTGSGDAVSANVLYDPWIKKAVATTATGTGPVLFSPSAGNVLGLTPVAAPSLPSVTFPHGMFSFQICCLTPGQTVDLTVTLPSAVPVGTVWWKYDNGRWYSLPNLNDNGDNIMVIRLTDGGTGDSDGQKDGFITDPGGPGNPMTVGWDGSPVGKAGVLAPWIALLAAVIAGTGLFVWKRRRVEI